MIQVNYVYNAILIRVIDGDTVVLKIDQGFDNETKKHIRLARINTPEIRGEEREEGLKSKAYVESLISPGDEVFVKTLKGKSFDRYIGEIYIQHEGEQKNLNDLLVENGYAEVYQ